MGRRLKIRVYQCRICGSIISTSDGVKRHGESCRLEGNIPNPKNMKQMASVDFPCPIILLHKIPSPLENKDQLKLNIASGKPLNHVKTLRPRPRYNKFLPINDDDNDDDTSHSAEGSEIENSSDSDSDGDTDTDTPTPKKSKINNKTKATFNKPDNPFPCPMKGCGARLKNKTALKSHFIIHLENNPYVCPIPGCGLKLAAQWYFKRHIESHMNKNQISCPKCGRILSRSDKLKMHQCPSKGKGRPKPDGRVKDKITKSEDEVIQCLRSHFAKLKGKNLLLLGDNDNLDAEIDLDFNPRIDLNKIIKTDPVFLEVCKEYPEFGNLIFWPEYKQLQCRNMNGAPMYQCNSCNFVSRAIRTLKDHYSLKHSHRPWRCLKCGRTFTKELYLEEHMKFHESTNNTIYWRQLENLKYECAECGFQSKFQVSVRRHWRLVHNVCVPKHVAVVPNSNEGKIVAPVPKKTSLSKFSTVTANEKSEYDIQKSLNNCIDKVMRESIDVDNDLTSMAMATAVKAEPDSDTGSEISVPESESEEYDYDCDNTQIKSENHHNDIMLEENQNQDLDSCDLLQDNLKSESTV